MRSRPIEIEVVLTNKRDWENYKSGRSTEQFPPLSWKLIKKLETYRRSYKKMYEKIVTNIKIVQKKNCNKIKNVQNKVERTGVISSQFI